MNLSDALCLVNIRAIRRALRGLLSGEPFFVDERQGPARSKTVSTFLNSPLIEPNRLRMVRRERGENLDPINIHRPGLIHCRWVLKLAACYGSSI